MCQPPTDQAVRAMLGPAVSPDVTIEKVRIVQSLRPQRIYEVLLSNGKTLHLVRPPPSMWRPMRSEQDMVASEAAVVRWISEVTSKQPQQQQNTSKQPTNPLKPLLPTLLHNGHEPTPLAAPFAVYAPVQGTPLALLLPNPPSPTQQTHLQTQLGSLSRDLAHLTSPTGRFGPLAAVLSSPPPTSASSTSSAPSTPPSSSTLTSTAKLRHHLASLGVGLGLGGLPGSGAGAGGGGSGLMASTSGAGSWSVAFHSMLEGVLRDGEDMAVAMGYAAVRRCWRRFGWVLDGVGVGRVVVIDLGLGTGGVLVVEEEEEDGGKGEGGDQGKEEGDQEGDAEEKKEKKTENAKGETEVAEEERDTQRLRLTGLRDWSSCVFGDPLLAAVFSDPQQQPPSAAFLEGFNGRKIEPARDRDLPLDKTIIEDVDNAWIRLLLYQVYHAVVHIVSEFYRPRPDSSARELEARRKLNEVLARLAEVPDDPKRRHQRPSGDMSPAKRFRGLPGTGNE